jgi:hypothetical protein
MANDAYSRAHEEAWEKDSFQPTFRRQGSELIAFTYPAVGRQEVHGSKWNAVLLYRTLEVDRLFDVS